MFYTGDLYGIFLYFLFSKSESPLCFSCLCVMSNQIICEFLYIVLVSQSEVKFYIGEMTT